MTDMEGTKIRVWKHKSKGGKNYLSGSMSKLSRLVIVPNDRKEEPSDPDYYAFIVPNRGPGQLPTEVDDL